MGLSEMVFGVLVKKYCLCPGLRRSMDTVSLRPLIERVKCLSVFFTTA